MNADEIRAILRTEADSLQSEGSASAASGLADFANTATDEEMVRFRELLLSIDDDGADEVDRLIAEGERAVDEAFYHDR